MRPIWKCTLTRSGRAGWAVNVPASLASFFPVGSIFIIALDDSEVACKVPPSIHDQHPTQMKKELP